MVGERVSVRRHGLREPEFESLLLAALRPRHLIVDLPDREKGQDCTHGNRQGQRNDAANAIGDATRPPATGATFPFSQCERSPSPPEEITTDSRGGRFIDALPEVAAVAEARVQYREVAFKVVLVGEQAVGKTSLIRRYVQGVFSEHYKSTLGTVVNKKQVVLPGPGGESVRATMMIWDIEGNQNFLGLVKQAYFKHCRGVLAVCDATRPETLLALQSWLENVHHAEREVATVILANKMDLPASNRLSRSLLGTLATKYAGRTILASAKTGLGVEEAFHAMATAIVGRALADTIPEPDPLLRAAEF